jgi:eukaryotic-like serine/threonine-protein kinase
MNELPSRTRAQLALGAEVAIELIDWSPISHAEGRFRLVRELAAAARIQSAHVVRILDHGFTTGGRGFIVLEPLHGEDLERHVAGWPPMSPSELAAIVMPVCAALAAGHALGIVHCNIEPTNVFLHEQDGAVTVKLLNFGITHNRDAADHGAAGPPLPSPYASPEQSSDRADWRSDLYSLTVLAYRCLAGRLPFEGPMPRRAPAPPSKFNALVSPALDRWFADMLRDDPDDRLCQSAAELASSFAAASGAAEPTPPTVRRLSARPAARARRLASTKSLARRALGPAIGGALVLVTGAIFAFWPRHQEEVDRALEPERKTSARQVSEPLPETPASRPIHVYFAATPTEAMMTLDGQRLDANPFATIRNADTAPHRLRAEAPGYHPIERDIALARDLTLELMLSPVAVSLPNVRSEQRSARQAALHTGPPQRVPTPPSSSAGPASGEAPPEPQTSKRALSVDRNNPWKEP